MPRAGGCPRPVLLCFLGLICGFLSSVVLLFFNNAINKELLSSIPSTPAPIKGSNVGNDKFLLVGIMTAAKYVDTRAYNVWRTWAQQIPGKVLFFVAENTVSSYPEIPLIRLKGVNDTYPPQKKSFAMMRWMYDNHLNDFDWFMRADDDLYVRGDRLADFLRSLDPNKAHLIGQAGLGNSAEYGQLALGPQDNYCMGGPGVVVSKETLRSVAPHLELCLLSLLTTHEDVELGRCIHRHVGVACTWNYEMQILFHNNQTQPNVYENSEADELRNAITLHPVKDPAAMRKLHVDAQSLRLRTLRSKRISLERELTKSKPSLSRRITNTTNDLQAWDYVAMNKISFCANQVTCPRHTMDTNMKKAVGEIVTELFDEFNKNARQRGRVLQFQNIQYGYARVEPRHGVDYVLDMILWFKKFRPPHRATLSVRRHAYVQQVFGEADAIADPEYRKFMLRRAAYFAYPKATEIPMPPPLQISDPRDEPVFLIVPLRGRAQTFLRFTENLRQIIPSDEKHVELVVVYYLSDESEDMLIKETLNNLNFILPTHVVEMNRASFSRGQALSAGSDRLSEDALMFFTDVDMIFSYETIQRIRFNTIRGAQIFFPIVFSEFSPRFWTASDRNDPTHSHFNYGRQRGYFRHFGYGLVSIFRNDFHSVGGFNLSIQGWGMEDVDFFEKVVSSKHLRVFRAPDPGLVHIYHDIHCPDDLPLNQRNMCMGSKAASIASLDSLAEHFSQFA